MRLDATVYDAVQNNWSEAARHVRMGNTPHVAGKGKGKGKSKSKHFDTEMGDFPFAYKLAEVKDWKYDQRVMEHGQDVAAEDADAL